VSHKDPNDIGNSAKYHTGKPCIEKGCSRPAGTAWSPYWCKECNVVRMDRISRQLNDLCKSPDQKLPEVKA